MTHRSVVLVFFLAAGCGTSLNHDAPFDPESPVVKQAKGRLTGTVLLEGESDHAGTDIQLQNEQRTYSVQTQGDGSFALTGVVPGAYTVRIGTRFFVDETLTVRIDLASESKLGLIRLAAKRAAVAGKVQVERVVNRVSSLEGGVQIQLLRTGSVRSGTAQPAPFRTLAVETGAEFGTVSGPDGTYAVADVPAGTYEVVASTAGIPPAAVATFSITGEQPKIDVKPAVLHPLTGYFDIEGSTGAGVSAVFSNSPLLTLKLAGFNASQMKLGSSLSGLAADCDMDPAESYAATATVMVPPVDGSVVLCVQFISAEGEETAPILESIILDMTPPALTSVRINDGAPTTDSLSVALAL